MTTQELIESEKMYEVTLDFTHYPYDEFVEMATEPYERFMASQPKPDWFVDYGDMWEIYRAPSRIAFDSAYHDGEVVPVTFKFFSVEQAQQYLALDEVSGGDPDLAHEIDIEEVPV